MNKKDYKLWSYTYIDACLEIARLALDEPHYFLHVAEKLDISDDELWKLRMALEEYMGELNESDRQS